MWWERTLVRPLAFRLAALNTHQTGKKKYPCFVLIPRNMRHFAPSASAALLMWWKRTGVRPRAHSSLLPCICIQPSTKKYFCFVLIPRNKHRFARILRWRRHSCGGNVRRYVPTHIRACFLVSHPAKHKKYFCFVLIPRNMRHFVHLLHQLRCSCGGNVRVYAPTHIRACFLVSASSQAQKSIFASY